jgi:diguanylate cyclase (GGDEF)-like protein/PAS domain S-box-containing protein
VLVTSSRTISLLVAGSLAFTLAALLLPFEVAEVLGGPLVVAGAYFTGRRGGMLTGLWASLSIIVAYFVLADVELDDLLVTVAGYLLLGIVLGIGIDRWRGQRDELRQTVGAMHAFQAQLSASQKRYRLLFESSNDAVYLHGLDANGEPTRFLAVNDAACQRLGYTREEMLGLLPRKLDAAPRPGQLREVMARLLQEDKVLWESELRARDGEKIPVEISSSLTDVDGEFVVLSIARDISGRKEQEQRLLELSLRDHLTGLLNRRGFLVMLPEHRKHAKRSGTRVVVLYADLDHLKEINDTQGHGRGDEAIKAVAEALQQTFREADLVARLGGDEFCVVAEADPAHADPEAFVARLEGALVEAGKRIGLAVSMSFGTVVTDWHGLEDARDLLERADALMYEDKRARRRGTRGAAPDGPVSQGPGGALPHESQEDLRKPGAEP